jgi:hypothetical protein
MAIPPDHITGQSLELFDGERLVARFESRYL